jgi:hypothetical protein
MDTKRTQAETDTEREEILSILARQIRAIDKRIEEYDIEESADEQTLIKWTRTLGYLSGQYRKLMKDTDIDEMEADLEFLKQAKEVMDDR